MPISNDKLEKVDINIEGIKEKVPFIICNHNNKNKKAFIFVGGLNSTRECISFFEHKIFNNATLINFDARGQGNNLNKPSTRPKRYAADLNLIVDYFQKDKKFKNINEWYLLGESWGSSICILYRKFFNKQLRNVKKIFIWNMPYKVINTSQKNKKELFIESLKMICSFLFGINFKTTNEVNTQLVENKTVERIFKMNGKKYVNTNPTIAAWLSFKKSWKSFNENNQNIYYLQSGNDILCDLKIIKGFALKNDKIMLIEKGSHLISLDTYNSKLLFDWINNKMVEK